MTDDPPAVPVSTYRLQVTADWPLSAAADLVPYLADLGADWVYLSPILAAEAGSGHGYDVVDHAEVDPDRGGDIGLRRVADAAHAAGRGVLVDIVPNHVGVATPAASVWWWDVLTHGRNSRYGEYFDVEWQASGGRIRLPILGDGEDELAALRIENDELCYYDHRLPIAPGTGGGSPREVLARQHYELMNYRNADTRLNYRRFFVINDLAAIRVELPEVFTASHAEIRRWIDRGWVDGLRIDHPDGLADPGRYLDDLAELTGGRYVLVEKIIEGDETLPASWACAGTTGYDALAAVDRLFVDPAGEPALDVLDTQLRGGLTVDWSAMTRGTKRAVADGLLRSEVLRLARLVPDVDRADDGIGELLASLAVYRTYLPIGGDQLTDAVDRATTARPELATTLRELDRRLRDVGTEFSTRFQQTSGMVMAKGVEDCAFYRWSRLTSLTEVGGEPGEFALSPQVLHDVHARRLTQSPATMTALSTHDTKRSEDVRSRISVISELPTEWAAAVRRWNRLAPFGDGALANLLWQGAVGAWPIDRHRLSAFAEKAAREAGASTAWIDPDAAFEQRLHALVDAVYDDADLHAAIGAFAARLTPRVGRIRCPPSSFSSWRPASRTSTRALSCGTWRWSTRTTDAPWTTPLAGICCPGSTTGGAPRSTPPGRPSCWSPAGRCGCVGTGPTCSPATRRWPPTEPPRTTCSPSTAAVCSRSSPGCRSVWPPAAGGGTPCCTCPRGTGATNSPDGRSRPSMFRSAGC